MSRARDLMRGPSDGYSTDDDVSRGASIAWFALQARDDMPLAGRFASG